MTYGTIEKDVVVCDDGTTVGSMEGDDGATVGAVVGPREYSQLQVMEE